MKKLFSIISLFSRKHIRLTVRLVICMKEKRKKTTYFTTSRQWWWLRNEIMNNAQNQVDKPRKKRNTKTKLKLHYCMVVFVWCRIIENFCFERAFPLFCSIWFGLFLFKSHIQHYCIHIWHYCSGILIINLACKENAWACTYMFIPRRWIYTQLISHDSRWNVLK